MSEAIRYQSVTLLVVHTEASRSVVKHSFNQKTYRTDYIPNSEIRRWMRDNIKSDYRWDRDGNVWFSSEADKALFLLRWF